MLNLKPNYLPGLHLVLLATLIGFSTIGCKVKAVAKASSSSSKSDDAVVVTSTATTTAAAPSAPTSLTMVTPNAASGTSQTPTIQVATVASGNTVAIYSDSACTTQLATGTAVGTTIDLTTNSLTKGTAYTIYSKLTSSGSASGCSTASVTYTVLNSLNLETPFEMLDHPIQTRNTGAGTILPSQIPLDTTDFDGTITYTFEIVASNSNVTNAYSIILSNSAAGTTTSISIPASSAAYRTSTTFTATVGADTYKLIIPQTAANGDIKLYSARILVRQTDATKTVLHFPLVNHDYSTVQTAETLLDSTTSTTLTQGTAARYRLYTKDTTPMGTISSWTLWAVAKNSAGGTTTVQLYNTTSSANVTNATVAITGATSTTGSATFTNSETNFTEDNEFDIRIKSSSGLNTSSLMKAGLIIKLTDLSKAEIHRRICLNASTAATLDMPNVREKIDTDAYSNPTLYFEGTGYESSAGIVEADLYTLGANDTATAGSMISSSGLVFSGSKTRVRSTAVSITSADRFMGSVQRTSGTLVLSGGCYVIIQAAQL